MHGGEESFWLQDRHGRKFGFVYYDLRPLAGTGQEARQTRAEALRLVSNFAKLPALLMRDATEADVAGPDDELQLKLPPAERAALVVVADLGLDAIEEFGLVPNTSTTMRAVEKLRTGKGSFSRTETLALQNAVTKGFKAAKRFGLPIELELAQRADGKLAALLP